MVREYPITSFQGLRLDREPDEVAANEALDLLNVDFDRRGAVRSRDGFVKFTAAEGTNRYADLARFETVGGTQFLIAGAGTRLEAIDTSGAVASQAGLTNSSYYGFARVGTLGGSSEDSYLFAGNGTDYIHRFDGSSWSVPAWSGTVNPTNKFLAVQSPDNRLVGAWAAANQFHSRVNWSQPGDPANWDVDDYVNLTPGDGENIMGMIAWGERLFIFKESKFFDFYGNSTDAEGNAVFNYRPVIGQAGLCASRALAASREGVYFLDRRGVYFTNGGLPTLVSRAVDGLFTGDLPLGFASSAVNQAQISQAAMCWHKERLYLAVPTGSSAFNDRLLVFDPQVGYWTLWSISAAALTPFAVSGSDDLMFAYATGTKDVGRFSSAYSSDDGMVISSRWRSGFYTPLDVPSQELTVRESVLDGQGSITFSVSRDFNTTLPTSGGGAGQTVTLGSAPSVTQGRHRVSQRGRRFSFQIESTGAWRVESVTQRLTGFREAGLVTT